MSRAFVKEDIDVPERSTRRRSASGLPPGALNYMTVRGAEALRARLADLKLSGQESEEMALLKEVLDSATIIQPQANPKAVLFGATVTLQSITGEQQSFRIAGVDEVDLELVNVSWVSPVGKALLGMALGQRVKLPPDDRVWWTVVAIE